MPEQNTSVATGLRNIYIAKVLTDISTGTTYGTPKKIAPAMTMKVTPSVNSATLNAEDGPLLTVDELGAIAVEIGVTHVPFELQAEMLGQTINEDGVLIGNADDIAPEYALGYERTMHDGKSIFVWLLKGKFQLLDDDATTKSGTPTFQTDTIRGTFLRRSSDNEWIYRLHSGMTEAKPAVIAAWFAEVYSGVATP